MRTFPPPFFGLHDVLYSPRCKGRGLRMNITFKKVVLLASLFAVLINAATSEEARIQNRFAATRGVMRSERADAAAVLLKDGRMLITGATSARGTLFIAET